VSYGLTAAELPETSLTDKTLSPKRFDSASDASVQSLRSIRAGLPVNDRLRIKLSPRAKNRCGTAQARILCLTLSRKHANTGT